jgi:hypothetical protein
VLTAQQFEQCITEAFCSEASVPVIFRLDGLFDVSAYYGEHINEHVKHYSKPHQFKFERGRAQDGTYLRVADDSPTVLTSYKHWSSSQTWFPSAEHFSDSAEPRPVSVASLTELPRIQAELIARKVVREIYEQADAPTGNGGAENIGEGSIEDDIFCWLTSHPTEASSPSIAPIPPERLAEFLSFTQQFITRTENPLCTFNETEKQTWQDYLRGRVASCEAAQHATRPWTLPRSRLLPGDGPPAIADPEAAAAEAFLRTVQNTEEAAIIPYSQRTRTALAAAAAMARERTCTINDVPLSSFVVYKYTYTTETTNFAAVGRVIRHTPDQLAVEVEWLRPLTSDLAKWGIAIDEARQAIRQDVDLEPILLFNVRMRATGRSQRERNACFPFHSPSCSGAAINLPRRERDDMVSFLASQQISFESRYLP